MTMPKPADRADGRPRVRAGVKLLAGLVIVLVLALVYWQLSRTGQLAQLLDAQQLHARVAGLGAAGPLAIIGFMALAIVLSPIPSAPIALAAGAAYGHLWGTLYVLIGAEIGALIAFLIARLVGYEMLRRWFGARLELGLLGSQNSLMVIVFVTRLLPFLSFDMVSYAAGLTPLALWRFALATLAGIVPVSFLLTHFGGEMVTGDSRRIALAGLALGAITLAPLAIKLLRDWRTRRGPSDVDLHR